MNKRIVVFAGNGCSPQKQDYYYYLAYKTGSLLVTEGFTVVTGGGPGLMDQVCRGAIEAGGKTIGVCILINGRKQSEYLSKKYIYHSLIPRFQKLISLGDAYIALPGGIGTFHEIFAVLALKRKKEISRDQPLIVVNSYFEEFRYLMDKMTGEGFADPNIESLYTIVKTPEEALTIINRNI